MRWVSTYNKKLLIDERTIGIQPPKIGGLEELLTEHAIHEFLFPKAFFPLFPALLAVQTSMQKKQTLDSSSNAAGMMAWVDPTETFYPPAAREVGISPRQLCILRPRPADLVWTAIECLRCKGIKAMVALMTQPLSNAR